MLDYIEQMVFKDGAYYSEITGVQKLLQSLDIPLHPPEPYGKLDKEEEETDEYDDIKSLDELDLVLTRHEEQAK